MDNQVENKEVVETPEVKIDQALVDRLTNELETLEKELDGKVYPVKIGSDDNLTDLKNFIQKEAKWKNMEALGIIEISKVLHEESLKGVKSGNIFLPSLPIQAISFFLSKVEGEGISNAERHIGFVKPIDEALKLIELDKTKLNKLQRELAAAENGIEVDNSATKENA